MNIEDIRLYCLTKQYTTESLPFNDQSLVFKVFDKIFAILSLDEEYSLNLKCETEKALDLREKYIEITPGYHMNKKLWNSINLNGKLTFQFIKQLIDHSYKQVVMKLPKNKKELIKE
jgi:predicted DNA-binding protein (MmcQ/YjbR family)